MQHFIWVYTVQLQCLISVHAQLIGMRKFRIDQDFLIEHLQMKKKKKASFFAEIHF